VRGLLDTSIFIAREQRRPLGELPDDASVSVMTIAELHHGVLVARDAKARASRLRTLAHVERTFDPLPVDAQVARVFAELVATARKRGRRPMVVDTIVAATALANGLPVYSQDRGFEGLSRVDVRMV
jgi:predicted nucleic acid-binding protein